MREKGAPTFKGHLVLPEGLGVVLQNRGPFWCPFFFGRVPCYIGGLKRDPHFENCHSF